MIERKKKVCRDCGNLDFIWAHKRCKRCDAIFKQNTRSEGTKIGEKTMYSFDKYKKRKKTGEYELFLKIYAERKGLCQITGDLIRFDVNNFAHILGKKAYPSYRLNPDNIIHIKPDIHHYYDNTDRGTLLKHYPEADIIYELKDKLRRQYYDGI